MTEPLFEVIKQNRDRTQTKNMTRSSEYQKVFQKYLTQSYGLYTEIFLKKACTEAQQTHPKLLEFHLRKTLREIIQKYLMNDLEIVFLIYFCGLHDWNFRHEVITRTVSDQHIPDPELIQSSQLKLFLNLVSYFTKTYIGDEQEVEVISKHNSEAFPIFNQVYRFWMENCPKRLFHISPRQLNKIYTQYSTNCNCKSTKKDYNHLVDQILDLSTTYSIMPTKEKKKLSDKKFFKKKSSNPEEEQIQNLHRKPSRSFESNIMSFSPRKDMADLKFSKRESYLFANGGSNQQLNGFSDTFLNNSNRSSREEGASKNNCEKREGSLRSSSLIKQQNGSDQQRNIGEIKEQKGGHKKIVSLSKKRKAKQEGVNDLVTNYFVSADGKDLKGQQPIDINAKDMAPGSFLDMNMRSSRIENLPFHLRSNSNIFGPSQLF